MVELKKSQFHTRDEMKIELISNAREQESEVLKTVWLFINSYCCAFLSQL